MIDFTQKSYMWQQEMNTLFQNVNLVSMELNNNLWISFKFISSFDGKPIGSLICENIWKFQFQSEPMLEFPVFIGDVRIHCLCEDEIKSAFDYLNYDYSIPQAKSYQLLCVEGGEFSLQLICEISYNEMK